MNKYLRRLLNAMGVKRIFSESDIVKTKRIQKIREGMNPGNIPNLANVSLKIWGSIKENSTDNLSTIELEQVKNVLNPLLQELDCSRKALMVWTIVPRLDGMMTNILEQMVSAKLKELRTATTEIEFFLS